MDNSRMDAHRGRAHRRNKRVRKLVLAVLQNLLVITCLLLSFSVYWRNAEEPVRILLLLLLVVLLVLGC